MTAYDYQKKYINRLRESLLASRAYRCEDCGAEYHIDDKGRPSLEWSHVAPTGLSGASRGLSRRLLDVKRNPESYRLRCKSCHAAADGRTLSAATYNAEEIAIAEQVEIAPIYTDYLYY